MRKNKFVSVFLFCSVLVTFISCATTSGLESIEKEINYDSETPLAKLEIQPAWEDSFWRGTGFKGFLCNFKNNSNESVRIVWAESSINYNGNSYVPFIDGQKYINAQEPMSPAVIAKSGTVSKVVYSSNQPYFISGQYGGWRMNNIEATDVQLLFMIKGKSKEEYITATIKAVPNKSSATKTPSESNK